MKGRIVITTQPADRARAMIDLLHLKGAVALSMPLIKTGTLLLPPRSIQNVICNMQPGLLVFTSTKGVHGFFENLMNVTGSYTLPHPAAIAVIGSTTAEAVKKYTTTPIHNNPGSDARDLANFLKEKVIRPGEKILLALGNLAPGFLEEELSEIALVRRINVYETVFLKPANEETSHLIRQGKADMIIFTSPSAFHSYLEHFASCAPVPFAAIGHTTAAAISEAGYDVAVTAETPSTENLADAIENFFSKHEGN